MQLDLIEVVLANAESAAVKKGSQMPRHLISGVHEWINEIPIVPSYYLAKPQPEERTWGNRKILLQQSFLAGPRII